ncbi:hypothetical protein PPMP20_26790 [Paraburkholderia phymatum]|uniref:Uncharacterized protein n=1 Tax=Paraburkholderia phymatum (strain DSM 17167 / CIP 108236 / LMG 21445 / STM815) TaxID=391038 RepID=B2JL05_PARP8|nr:hypothetical protein [Paraburkholderia phymatum]ACC72534.1 hypothetical protein Bphy_3380 [Paraburkholderia phymatum STM815]
MDILPDPVTFEASGLPCVIIMTIAGRWLACVEITREHALYRRRREVEVAVPDALAGLDVTLERVAYADISAAKLPAVLDSGASLPASILLACPGGIMYTGVAYDGRPGKWWIGFNMPGETSHDEVRVELEHFAALVAALAQATVTGGPAAAPEV